MIVKNMAVNFAVKVANPASRPVEISEILNPIMMFSTGPAIASKTNFNDSRFSVGWRTGMR
jgi:hypothetical protein